MTDTCPHGNSRGWCGDPACIPERTIANVAMCNLEEVLRPRTVGELVVYHVLEYTPEPAPNFEQMRRIIAAPDPLYGQCRCGAALTVDHIRNHCPLRQQQVRAIASMTEAQGKELRALVVAALAQKFDTTHVAELGYN